MSKDESNQSPVRPDPAVYRGWHLGQTSHEAMTTEFEWSILRFQQAFERFCLQVANISGLVGLSYPELILLHVIGMQERPKTAALIARQLNSDAINNIQYSLRKLLNYKLIVKIKEGGGKIYTYDVTKKGRVMVNEYAQIRQLVLTEQTKSIEEIDRKLYESAKLISLLTGLYDEAARISATYSSVALSKMAQGE
jgi:predicted MarR family transcription regulator